MRNNTLFVQTRYGNHMIVLEPDERKGYVAIAPALPGVITWGENMTHAKEMAKEAIELCIESLVEKRPSAKAVSRPEKSRKVLVKV